MSETPTNLKLIDIVKDINKCIICQRLQDNKNSKKLTSTQQGRESIIDCSRVLKDELLEGIQESNYCQIKYHVQTCYPRYKRAREREELRNAMSTPSASSNDQPTSSGSPKNRPKRRKLIDSVNTPPQQKPCIICNNIKSKVIFFHCFFNIFCLFFKVTINGQNQNILVTVLIC